MSELDGHAEQLAVHRAQAPPGGEWAGPNERTARRQETIMQLEDQIVIVTGGAAGIGGAISRVLVRRGAKVVGQPTQAAYASAKEAIRGLSRVVANEWASQNIRVNVVSPMAMTAGVQAWSQAYPDMYQDSLSKVPLGRFGDPESDVAPIVAFLLSDDAKYMTGQTLMADGGANKLY